MYDYAGSPKLNDFQNGDFSEESNIPARRSGSSVVDIGPDQAPLHELGYSSGIRWRMGNDYVLYDTGVDLRGKWVVAGFIVWSEIPADISGISGATVLGADGSTLVNPVGDPDFGVRHVGDARIVWASRQFPANHPNPFDAVWIGTASAPVTNGRFATGFFAKASDTKGSAEPFILEIFERARVKRLIPDFTPSPSPTPEVGDPITLTLSGAGIVESYIEAGDLKRGFTPFPIDAPLERPVFNLRSDYIGDVLLRDGTDDIAPDHIDGATVGANHGYTLGEVTSAGHGKTFADGGSVWASGGKQYVLAD